MPTRGEWEGITGVWWDDETAVDGKRFVASKTGYTKLRNRYRARAGERCEVEGCGRSTFLGGEIHHVYGRGMGGSKRDDRREVNGVRMCIWECKTCHKDEVIKPWGSWKDSLDNVGAT